MADTAGPFGLHELAAIIEARVASTAERSYTKALLDAGVARAAKKLGEEAVETVIAAVAQDDAAVIAESADLLYHLLVVLRARAVPLDAVMAELCARTRQSGLREKASRLSSEVSP